MFAMNHYFAIPTQLADGVRSLNVDLYEQDGELIACHGDCGLGWQLADELWTEISDFLRANADEVVLIDVEDGAPAGVVNRSIAAHALGRYGWVQEVGEPWPSLGEMLDEGGQLVFFNTPVKGVPEWVLDPGEFLFGTGWLYASVEQLDCAVEGEVLEHGLYEMTHVLTNPISSPDYAGEINQEGVLVEHLERCLGEVGRANMVSVDYYSLGGVFEALEGFNGG
jgi:hypothetical protein